MRESSPSAATIRVALAAAAAGVGAGTLLGLRLASRAPPPPPSSAPSAAAASADDDDAGAKTTTPGSSPPARPPPPDHHHRWHPPAPGDIARPIAIARSCFSRRNGTPRQGGDLVPSARCVLTLHPALPRDLLAGLDEFTHVWIIYAFHANTNANNATIHAPPVVKAKVRVPRLDGAVRGALATRTPHRPVPVGLSLARVVDVNLRLGAITLAGADLVDGTPVLDVKPYVPFCDRVEDAEAPSWVGRGGGDEGGGGEEDPLAMRRVSIPDDVAKSVGDAYERGARAKRAKRVGYEPADPAKAAEAETPEAVAAEASTSYEARVAGRGGSVGGGGGGGEKEKKEASKDKNEASREKKEASKEKKIASKETIASAADHRKALKKALKDRRRSGLEPPDALYPSGAAFVALVREVLALDVRSTRERVADARAKRFETYRVTLCDVEVEYEVDEREREVRVLGAREVEPLERPGETRRDAFKETNE